VVELKRARIQVTYDVVEQLLRLPDGVRIRAVDDEGGGKRRFILWVDGDGLPDRCETAEDGAPPFVSPRLRMTEQILFDGWSE